MKGFERKDKWQQHVDGVHLKTAAVECPTQCGHTSSRYHRENIFSIMSPRVDSLPLHFERVHYGRFLATARLQVCSRCGSCNSCNCSMKKQEMDRKKMEHQVRHELGLNSATRRYAMAQPFAKVWCTWIFSDVFIFSMTFTGQPERSPNTTRITIAVNIDIVNIDTKAIRVLRNALSIFSDLSIKPNGK